jgi:hypothetical protein
MNAYTWIQYCLASIAYLFNNNPVPRTYISDESIKLPIFMEALWCADYAYLGDAWLI